MGNPNDQEERAPAEEVAEVQPGENEAEDAGDGAEASAEAGDGDAADAGDDASGDDEAGDGE